MDLVLARQPDRAGLDAGIGEVERLVPELGPGRGKALAIGTSLPGVFFDLRSTGIGEADELRHFVKRLADGVVARPIEHRGGAAADVVDGRMPSGDEYAEKAIRQRDGSAFPLQVGREDVSLEVVHGNDRNAKPETEALRARYADEECPDQPRPRGDGDLLDVLPGRTPISECPAHERKEMLQVFTR